MYRCSYLTQQAILNIRIFCRRYHFRLWVFASTGEYFTIDTDDYYVMCYKVNDTRTFKNLVGVGLYYFMLCANKSSHTYIADWLI